MSQGPQYERIGGDWWWCDTHSAEFGPFYCCVREALPECDPRPVYREIITVPESKAEAMAALGDLLAGAMPDPDDEDLCEAGLEQPDPDRISHLVANLEESILAARAKREEAQTRTP